MLSSRCDILIFALGIFFLLHEGRSEGDLNVRLNTRAIDNALEVIFGLGSEAKLYGLLGITLPESVGSATACSSGSNSSCFQWGDYAQVLISTPEFSTANDNCARVEWTSSYARKLEDCYDIGSGVHWYGGGETWKHTWPIEDERRPEVPYVTGGEYNGVTENYWLVSTGIAIVVDEDTPLFFSLNTTHLNKVCYSAKDVHPFSRRTELTLKYTVCAGENLKVAHQTAQSKFYSLPTGIPDEIMILHPLWSTWAQYHADVNQEIVLNFARRIKDEGYLLNSHIEIDDNWESCYGEAEFNAQKFPDPAGMVQTLKEMGFRVTLWIHPFINMNCPSFRTGVENSYFVRTGNTKSGIISWWAGSNAGIVDYTNPEAVNWWKTRLERLQSVYGIDSFKFDAGESNYLPHSIRLSNGNENEQPNSFTKVFVDSVSSFGSMVEVRASRQNQAQPIFFRMFDKDSRWGYDNGLKSVIPTLLHFGVLGYPFVLPDMIGGNAYGGRPSKELYVRWMQANAFMPAVQISLVPWDYDSEVLQITRDILALRESYRNAILLAANQSLSGAPINRPMWWVDPNDQNTYDIDSQYMLGDDLLVAPVLDEGATSRDIYLPQGTWVDGIGSSYTGPIWIRNYSADLTILPYFIRQSSQFNQLR